MSTKWQRWGIRKIKKNRTVKEGEEKEPFILWYPDFL
jgi:hypothetical protein